MKIHLDTDIGGDIDDVCALAMLLRWPNVELVGITTSAEAGGRRAGYAHYVVALEGKQAIPIAAGADVSLDCYRFELGYPPETMYWPEPIVPAPNALERALRLLKQSIEADAVIAVVGPYTNLYLLEKQYPGILKNAKLFLMGGYVFAPRTGYPQQAKHEDFNVQMDVQSALYVLEHSSPTLVPLAVTVETSLRRAFLQALEQAGTLGSLLARQARAWSDWGIEEKFGKSCESIPDDTINFQHDPLTCAIALGWNDGVAIEQIPLRTQIRDGWLDFTIDETGKLTSIVTKVNGPKFNHFWLDVILQTNDKV